jgi:hypothetical protein
MWKLGILGDHLWNPYPKPKVSEIGKACPSCSFIYPPWWNFLWNLGIHRGGNQGNQGNQWWKPKIFCPKNLMVGHKSQKNVPLWGIDKKHLLK